MLTVLLWASLALLFYSVTVGEFPEAESLRAALKRHGAAAASAALFFVAASVLFGTPLAGAVWAAFGWVLPGWVSEWADERRRARLKSLAADFVTSAAGLYAVGQTTPDVVRVMAERLPEPLAGEFRRMIGAYNMNPGASFPRMFREVAEKYGLPEFGAVAGILAAGERAGGPPAVSRGLKRLGRALRQRDRLAAERRKATMEPRVAAVVVVVVLGAGLLVDAAFFRGLFAGAGRLVLAAGSALVVGIVFLFRKVSRSEDLA